MSGKYIHKIGDIPKGEHWAILRDESVTIPGDERSRTNPGHGYPESTEHYMNYVAFTNEAEFRKELESQIAADTRYGYSAGRTCGIHVQGVYSAATTITLSENK